MIKQLLKIWLNQDTLISVDAAKDPISKQYINDATATLTVKDKLGTTLAGPIAMDYVTASDGDYVGVIPNISSAVAGQRAIVIVSLQSGTGYGNFGEWEYNAVFEVRNQNNNCGC